jgi:hypothetical protein
MKKLLLLLSLGILLFSCGSDDDNGGTDNGGVSPTSLQGTWTVESIEVDVQAESQETTNAVKQLLTSDKAKNKTKLVLQYITVEKSFEYDFKDGVSGNLPGGEMYFNNNVLTPRYPTEGVKFEYKSGKLYREYDYAEYLKNSHNPKYPDVQKAVQKMYLKK